MLILAPILAIFLYGMVAATLGTILPDLSVRYSLTPQQNGSIAFTQGIGLTIASVVVGPLMDWQGQKIGLAFGLALVATALFALPASRTSGTISALMLALGAGSGIIITGGNSLAAAVDAAHRAVTLNLVNIFFGLGGMATPFLAANFLAKNSARLCRVVGCIAVIALIECVIAPIPAPAGSGFVFSHIGAVAGNPMLFLLALMTFLYVSCEVGVWNWLVRHLVAQGVPEPRALNILSLGFALGLLTGRAGIAPVLIHLPATTALIAGSTAMTVTTLMMFRTRSDAAAGVWVFLAGISMAPIYPTTLSIGADVFPQTASTALGVVVASGSIGVAVSSRVIGAIAGPDPKRLGRALLLIPAFSALMLGVALMIRAAIAG